MFCVRCGGYIEKGQSFCTACGAKVELSDGAGQGTPAVSTTPVAGQVVSSQPVSEPQQPPRQPSQSPQAQKGGISKAAIIVIAVIAALAVIGIIVGLTQSSGDKSDGGTSTYTIESGDSSGSNSSGSDSAENSGSTDSATTTDNSDSSGSTQSSDVDDQAQREDAARQAAIDAGKEVFTGRVIVTTMAQRAHDREPNLHDFDNYDDQPYVVLQMDSTMQVEANSGDGQGMRTGDCDSFALPIGQFDAYDGQTITIAAYPSDMWFYSDVTGVLAQIHINTAELIAPLGGSAPAASSGSDSSSAGNGDYVLPDSDSRYYTRAELEAMDDLDLYHARNEIFARHGRIFKNPDLQEYFGSKSWYNGTIAPEDFDEEVLNDYEDENAKLMLAIEQERNSPYLS